MIQIAKPITLEQLLPLIQKLSKVEREQLRKSLEADPDDMAGGVGKCRRAVPRCLCRHTRGRSGAGSGCGVGRGKTWLILRTCLKSHFG